MDVIADRLIPLEAEISSKQADISMLKLIMRREKNDHQDELDDVSELMADLDNLVGFDGTDVGSEDDEEIPSAVRDAFVLLV